MNHELLVPEQAVLEAETQWQALVTRNAEYDGQFVYGVTSTHIYCRPSCPSRQPKRHNVRFFSLPAQAEAQGFRPCKRCKPRQQRLMNPKALLVQALADYLHDYADQAERWTSEALSQHFHYDAHYLQEVFKQALGMTPRQYAEIQRSQKLKQALRHQNNVSSAIYSAGYTSLSQVYERTHQHLGMTPADYQRQGAGLSLSYGTRFTSFGHLMVALSARGVCAIGLYDDETSAQAALRQEFPQAQLLPADDNLEALLEAIVAHVQSGRTLPDLPFDLQATAFQWKVWRALQAIPHGETRTYAQIAHAIGQASAVRAVANACAHNRAAILIPCHRVIGSDGTPHGYKWGVERKRRLLTLEQTPSESGQEY